MFIKVFSVIALAGALLVTGDATIKGYLASSSYSKCVVSSLPVQQSCCAKQAPCCQQEKPCCATAYSYCTRTGEVYEGCCCEIVDGLYRCLITGEVSDECCCIPLE